MRGSELERFETRAQLIEVFIASRRNHEDSHQLLILFLVFSSTKRGSQFYFFAVALGNTQLHLFITISHRQSSLLGQLCSVICYRFQMQGCGDIFKLYKRIKSFNYSAYRNKTYYY